MTGIGVVGNFSSQFISFLEIAFERAGQTSLKSRHCALLYLYYLFGAVPVIDNIKVGREHRIHFLPFILVPSSSNTTNVHWKQATRLGLINAEAALSRSMRPGIFDPQCKTALCPEGGSEDRVVG